MYGSNTVYVNDNKIWTKWSCGEETNIWLTRKMQSLLAQPSGFQNGLVIDMFTECAGRLPICEFLE